MTRPLRSESAMILISAVFFHHKIETNSETFPKIICDLCFDSQESHSQSGLPPSNEVTRYTQVDKEVADRLEAQNKEFISYKAHDGIMKCKKTKLPPHLVKAMRLIMESKYISVHCTYLENSRVLLRGFH